MKNYAIIILCVLLLSACVAGPNPVLENIPMHIKPAGFWRGLWHGMICPITFLVSIFTDSVSVYEVHNTGGWYDFGFVLGLGSSVGGGSSASSGSSSSRRRSR